MLIKHFNFKKNYFLTQKKQFWGKKNKGSEANDEKKDISEQLIPKNSFFDKIRNWWDGNDPNKLVILRELEVLLFP